MSKIIMMRNDAGGEGSRGGKIIGHTSGGKPVYASAGHASHGSFSAKDHREAAQLHRGKLSDLVVSGKGESPAAERHRKQRDLHHASSDKIPSTVKKQHVKKHTEALKKEVAGMKLSREKGAMGNALDRVAKEGHDPGALEKHIKETENKPLSRERGHTLTVLQKLKRKLQGE